MSVEQVASLNLVGNVEGYGEKAGGSIELREGEIV